MIKWQFHALLMKVLLGALGASFILIQPIFHTSEIFPIFSWSLFTYVPNERVAFDVEIVEINGTPLDEPTLLSEAVERFPLGKSITTYHLIQRFGQSHLRKDHQQKRYLRGLLESQLRSIGHLKYRLALLRFNPMDRYFRGTRELERIATFTMKMERDSAESKSSL